MSHIYREGVAIQVTGALVDVENRESRRRIFHKDVWESVDESMCPKIENQQISRESDCIDCGHLMATSLVHKVSNKIFFSLRNDYILII
jgi:hypothetical protein